MFRDFCTRSIHTPKHCAGQNANYFDVKANGTHDNHCDLITNAHRTVWKKITRLVQ